MDINKKLIKFNTSSRKGSKIEYIVIHDTGNKNIGADAESHYKYFNGGNRNSSAHYFVDDKEILQLVEDSQASWHCGDGKGKYGITNSNSIGIEICVNSDGDYAKAVDKTVKLTAYLMKRHNIPLKSVIRHFDVSRKNCPASMSKNDWEGWRVFKIALERELSKKENSITLNIQGKVYEMDGVFKDNKNYVGVRELAEALGHTVSWDQVNKIVVIK